MPCCRPLLVSLRPSSTSVEVLVMTSRLTHRTVFEHFEAGGPAVFSKQRGVGPSRVISLGPITANPDGLYWGQSLA